MVHTFIAMKKMKKMKWRKNAEKKMKKKNEEKNDAALHTWNFEMKDWKSTG